MRVDHVALGMIFFGRDDTSTGTNHQAGRCLCGLCGLPACLTNILIEQIFKHGTVAFEAGGIDVGQVIRDNAESGLLRIQTGLGYPH